MSLLTKKSLVVFGSIGAILLGSSQPQALAEEKPVIYTQTVKTGNWDFIQRLQAFDRVNIKIITPRPWLNPESRKFRFSNAQITKILQKAGFSGNGVNLDGFYTPFFNINDYIEISNTSLNNGKYRIVAVEYSLIPNKTILTFAEPTQSESVGGALIKAYDYLLSGNFYDSIEFQGSPPQEDQLPYGQHQNQAVWNQYNRVFTAFEATVDGLDTDKTDKIFLL